MTAFDPRAGHYDEPIRDTLLRRRTLLLIAIVVVVSVGFLFGRSEHDATDRRLRELEQRCPPAVSK